MFLIMIIIQLYVFFVWAAIRIGSLFYQNLTNLLLPSDNQSAIVSPVISSTTNCRSCLSSKFNDNVTIQLHIEVWGDMLRLSSFLTVAINARIFLECQAIYNVFSLISKGMPLIVLCVSFVILVIIILC